MNKFDDYINMDNYIHVSYIAESLTEFNLVNAFVNKRKCRVRFESGLWHGSNSALLFYRDYGDQILKIGLVDDGILEIGTASGKCLKTSKIKAITGNPKYIRIETEHSIFHFCAVNADEE